MEKTYKVLIITDSNRKYMEVIMTDNLLFAIQDIYTSHLSLFNTTQQLTRIVYEETYASEASANKRYQELKGYTRMVRERLVRRRNPNWLNLYPVRPMPLSCNVLTMDI